MIVLLSEGNMHASPEEFMLLLKKWSSESTGVHVKISCSPPDGFRTVFTINGIIELDEKGAKFAVHSACGSVFVCHMAPYGFAYSTASEGSTRDLLDLVDDPEDVNELGIIRNESAAIIIYTFHPNDPLQSSRRRHSH